MSEPVGEVALSAVHPGDDGLYQHEFTSTDRIPVGAELFIRPARTEAEIYAKAQRETAALCAYMCKDMPGGEAIAEKINGIGKDKILPYRVVRYGLSAAEQESELREQLILMGWTPPPSTQPNAITGKKWQQLCQEGYRANGIAFCKGDEQGLITDFGKVLWWKTESAAQEPSSLDDIEREIESSLAKYNELSDADKAPLHDSVQGKLQFLHESAIYQAVPNVEEIVASARFHRWLKSSPLDYSVADKTLRAGSARAIIELLRLYLMDEERT